MSPWLSLDKTNFTFVRPFICTNDALQLYLLAQNLPNGSRKVLEKKLVKYVSKITSETDLKRDRGGGYCFVFAHITLCQHLF